MFIKRKKLCVITLAGYGYLEQVPGSRKYRLVIGLFEMGNLVLFRIDIRNEAKDLCAFLTPKYPAAVHTATHSVGEVICVDKLDVGLSLSSSIVK